ncbi:MAG: DUF1573 domain-containing protein, partial [Bacteroidota bacterium]
LSFDLTSQAVGVLDSDKAKELVFRVKNNGPKPISFQPVDMLEAEVVLPSVLTPGSKADIKVNLKGGNFLAMGPFSKSVVLRTNDDLQPEKSLTVTGTLNKVYSEAELAQMPNIEFEKTVYEGGTVLEGEKVTYAYKFTNTGKTDLEIASVKASCGCTASAPKDKVVKPGQTSEIIATFNSQGRKGVQQKSITVRTNDPDNGTVILRLKVEVEADPFHVGGFGPAAGSN